MEKKTTPTVKKPAAKKPAGERYIEAVGRRKTSVARVRLYPGKKEKKGAWDITVNDKPLEKFFYVQKQQRTVVEPMGAVGENISATVVVKGGGINSQAEAVRMGFARALVTHDPNYRSKLKAMDFLKRDPRMVERKKFGSRKARRPQQWRKR
jgi:small subunit ribosomal protein S9